MKPTNNYLSKSMDLFACLVNHTNKVIVNIICYHLHFPFEKKVIGPSDDKNGPTVYQYNCTTASRCLILAEPHLFEVIEEIETVREGFVTIVV